jgi:hypothetical protein
VLVASLITQWFSFHYTLLREAAGETMFRRREYDGWAGVEFELEAGEDDSDDADLDMTATAAGAAAGAAAGTAAGAAAGAAGPRAAAAGVSDTMVRVHASASAATHRAAAAGASDTVVGAGGDGGTARDAAGTRAATAGSILAADLLGPLTEAEEAICSYLEYQIGDNGDEFVFHQKEGFCLWGFGDRDLTAHAFT